ncbi:MAG: MoaD/ThiS family protein [Chitinophagales bacterium]
MPIVKFTNALKRFFPGLKDTPTHGKTLEEILREVEASYPGISSYLLDEQHRLRRHVNIFIDGTLLSDRDGLKDSFSENSEIFIIQALSGG